MHGKNLHNEYARVLGDLLDRAPKAVLAAIAVSYAIRIEEASPDDDATIQAAILDEWRILHENGIVPQAPPRVTPCGAGVGRPSGAGTDPCRLRQGHAGHHRA